MIVEKKIQIAGKQVGVGEDVLLIAEVGLAHDGSLGAAHAYVDSAAEIGVDAVKFQTHIAEEESTQQERFRVNVFPQDKTRYDYWKRTAFSPEQWIDLANHAREKGLLFLSSPFSNLAVEWLLACDVPAWKVASGELTNTPMLEKMCQTNKPLLISSGMSDWRELDKVVAFITRHGGSFGIFQCTTSYPCPPGAWGLNLIPEMRERYACPVGLSDHSGEIAAGIAAAVLGASMLEFHVAFSKSQFGPDAKASLTFEQAHQLVNSVRNVQAAMRSPVDKDKQARALNDLHSLFTKSMVAARDLEIGTRLRQEHVACKKPGMGLPPELKESILGKLLKRSVKKDQMFSLDDFH